MKTTAWKKNKINSLAMKAGGPKKSDFTDPHGHFDREAWRAAYYAWKEQSEGGGQASSRSGATSSGNDYLEKLKSLTQIYAVKYKTWHGENTPWPSWTEDEAYSDGMIDWLFGSYLKVREERLIQIANCVDVKSTVTNWMRNGRFKYIPSDGALHSFSFTNELMQLLRNMNHIVRIWSINDCMTQRDKLDAMNYFGHALVDRFAGTEHAPNRDELCAEAFCNGYYSWRDENPVPKAHINFLIQHKDELASILGIAYEGSKLQQQIDGLNVTMATAVPNKYARLSDSGKKVLEKLKSQDWMVDRGQDLRLSYPGEYFSLEPTRDSEVWEFGGRAHSGEPYKYGNITAEQLLALPTIYPEAIVEAGEVRGQW